MSKQFKVGDIVEGIGFIVNLELNGAVGTIVEDLGEVDWVSHSGETSKKYAYQIAWEHNETDAIAKQNLKLKRPPADTGEQSILSLFKMAPSRYNFDHHKEIREEMAREKAEEEVAA